MTSARTGQVFVRGIRREGLGVRDRASELRRGSRASSRREALRRASIAAAALAAGGGIGLARRPASAAAALPSPAQDRAIFNFALLLEYLQAAFYSEAVQRGALTGDVRRFAEVVSEHERAHVAFLRKALGPHARARPQFKFGKATGDERAFLKAAVLSKANIIVSGGTGTGKTTFLNVLSGFIPVEDRIVTIEDAAELQLHQEHVCRLETRPKDINGEGEITIQRLVINSLRMRPERIVVGECRGGEALDMLQAMNTGHDGSMTTLHANSPRDALARLETLVLMAGVDLPIRAIRQQVAGAINLIVQLSRLRDGSRKVTGITEIVGMEQDVITTQDIFVLEQKGATPDGKVLAEFRPTGLRPKILDRMFAQGIPLPKEITALFPPPPGYKPAQK